MLCSVIRRIDTYKRVVRLIIHVPTIDNFVLSKSFLTPAPNQVSGMVEIPRFVEPRAA